MAEYIEREALDKALTAAAINDENKNCNTWSNAIGVLYNLPAADVAPVVHGRWRALRKYDGRRTYRCSACGRTIRLSLAIDINEYAPYCNCGARMDGDDDDKAD